MNMVIHQAHITIAHFDGVFEYLEKNKEELSSGVHLFPELFLTGYPLQDLCLQKSFVLKYLETLDKLEKWLDKNLDKEKTCLLFGGLKYELTENQLPKTIENVVFQFGSGQDLQAIYSKRLLPNYDIFDEKKYFFKGSSNTIVEIFGKSFGILICEDMWASNIHQIDPVNELLKEITDNDIELDAVLNFSASPYNRHKHQKRKKRASEVSHLLKCPFFYINKVGGEDEILFDGRSFVINGGDLLIQGMRFISDRLSYELPKKIKYQKVKLDKSLTWEELFAAELEESNGKITVSKLDDDDCQEILEALCFGVQEYAKKSGFKSFSIALSGGMDSALVLTLIRMSLKEGQSVEAIYMPSIHSSPLSHELSLKLCQNLGIQLKSLPIKFLHSTGKNLFTTTFQEEFEGLTDENIQARLRGLLLYTRSNQKGSMVVNTSNKSELAVGYSTQYGDSVGAISMLGDLYKSEVFHLAHYINKKYGSLIPEEIITRPPTAELRPGQMDEQSLPPYEVLDAILEGLLSYRHSRDDLLKMGFSEEDVDKTINLYRKTEYKRYQFCPIIKINSKSFGFGYRIPLSKDSGFYT